MSLPHPMFGPNQLNSLFYTIAEDTRTHPFKCLAVLVLLLVGYTFRRFVTPSVYPNIDGPAGGHIIFGHLLKLFSPSEVEFHEELQETYGSITKVQGFFGKENLYVSDPRFLHEIVVKEPDAAFTHPSYFHAINAASFGPGLGACGREEHRAQRKVPVFHEIAQKMKDAIFNEMGEAQTKELDLLRWCSAAALEMLGRAGLGHSFGVLDGTESVYIRAIKTFLPEVMRLGPLMGVFPFIYRITPTWIGPKLAKWAPAANVRNIKKIIDIQEKQAQTILAERRAALRDHQGADEPRDLMSVLLRTNMEANEEDRLSDAEILGQMNTLVFAGHELPSSAIARIIHILSQNPSIQDRLRAEITEAPESMTYEEVNSLPYLDAICREALRLFPPTTFMERETNEDRIIPLRYPVKGKDGKEIREIRVRKGTNIYIGIRTANRCKETWGKDANEFRPERWLQDLPNSVIDAKLPGVYSSTMTFLGGPRTCIGYKFAILELKIVLSMLLRSFKFAPGTTQISWLNYLTLNPYPHGTKNPAEEGIEASLDLKVSVI